MAQEQYRYRHSPARLRFRELVNDIRRRQASSEALLREKLTVVKTIDFSHKAFQEAAEGPISKAVPIIKEHLTLAGEEWPEGYGFIGGFYDEKSRELRHVFLGRVINSNGGTGELMILGLRYSPSISESLLFQVEAPENSPLLDRLRPDHRKSVALTTHGDILLNYAQTVIPEKIY